MRTLLSLLLMSLCLVLPAQGAESVSRVVAVVNGVPITAFDLESAMAPELVRARIDPKKSADRAQIRQIERMVLEGMINDIVLSQEAERLKVTVSESDVDAELAAMKSRMRLSEADFDRQLKAQGLTLSALRARLRTGLLKSRLLNTMVGRKVVVTKDEVEAYFHANQGRFSEARAVRFAILMYPPSANAVAQAERIRSGATTFEKVTREMSIGPRKQEGGDLGEMPWEDVAPGLQELLSRLKPGEVSPLLDLDGRKVQIKLISKETGPIRELDPQSYAEAERMVREPKLEERYKEYVEQLRNRAVVDIRN